MFRTDPQKLGEGNSKFKIPSGRQRETTVLFFPSNHNEYQQYFY